MRHLFNTTIFVIGLLACVPSYAETKSVVAEAQVRATAEAEAARNRPKYVTQGGLDWMPVLKKGYTYAQAYKLCSGTINGQNGWRLPTKDELAALYNSRALKGQGWTLYYTWSSTPYGSGIHYGVDLINGNVYRSVDTYINYVSCVR